MFDVVVVVLLGVMLIMFEVGWLVVILVYGIISKKEDMLVILGVLFLVGVVIIVID